jgi:hypothetical protein
MKKTAALFIVIALLAGIPNVLHAQEKSTALALGLSITAPALCLFTGPGIVLGLTVAPSAGHIYAGQWGRGLMFSGLRTAAIVVAVYPALPYVTGENMGRIWIGLGACGFITLIDWFMVPSSVQKYNERFQIQPEIDPSEGTYSIGISYRF